MPEVVTVVTVEMITMAEVMVVLEVVVVVVKEPVVVGAAVEAMVAMVLLEVGGAMWACSF